MGPVRLQASERLLCSDSNLSAALAVLSKYMTELRDYPREEAGWFLAPASLAMAASTFLTTYFHRRRLRHA
jgi:hypothetical protein